MTIKVNSEHFDKQIKGGLIFFVMLLIVYINSYFIFSFKQLLTGDQPHYLLVTHSIVNGFDLDLKNNYLNKDFKSFYPHEALDTHISPNSVNGHWYPIHNIGLSVLVIPFYFIGKLIHKEQFMVILLMSFLMAGTAVNLYSVCRRLLGEDKNLVIPIMASFLSLPLIGYSMQVYPEVPAIFILSYLMKVYLDSKVGIIKSILIGISMGFLGWLHVKFLALAIPFLILFYFSKDVYKSDKMRYIPLLIFIFVVAGMSLSFYYLYGSFSFSSQYISLPISIKHLPQRVLRNFLDQHDGIFFYSPFYIFSIAGFISIFKNSVLNEHSRKLLVMMMATFAGFIFMISLILIDDDFFIPPRFLVPVLPLLVIAISAFVRFNKNKFVKVLFMVLSICSVVLAFIILWVSPLVLFKDFTEGSSLLLFISSQKMDFRQVLPNLNSVFQPYANLALGSVMCLFILFLNLYIVSHGKMKKVFVQLIIISVIFYLGLAVYNTHLMRLANSNKIINYIDVDNAAIFVSEDYSRTRLVNISDKTPHLIGSAETTPEGTILHSPKDHCGFLVFGPYWRLKKGSYRVKFNLMADGDANQEIATIDVHVMDADAHKEAVEPIRQKVISTGKSEWKEYTINFNIEMNVDNNLLYEFRVFATGRGDVKVKGIILESR